MGKSAWKPGTVLYPVPSVMVSLGDMDGSSNIITVAWTGIVNTEPPMTYISVRPSRHSYAILKDAGEFVINLTTEKLAFACDFCGVRSGRDVDKFEKTQLTKRRAQLVKAPLIEESPVNLECKVKEILQLGSHHMFLSEIIAVNVSDEFLDETGKFHFEASKPICYSHGKYYTLGKALGKFGYSVQKNNSKNQIRKGKYK